MTRTKCLDTATFGMLALLFFACGDRDAGMGVDDANETAAAPGDARGGPSGDAATSPPALDHGRVSDTFPAFLPAVPQLLKQAGPILSSPEITPITFDSDDASARATMESFVHQLGNSAYWSAVTSEYGIGAAKDTIPLHVAEPAPDRVDEDAVRSWLTTQIVERKLAPNPNSIYAIFYPATTAVTFKGMLGCKDFGGYHQSTNLANGQRIAYVVVPRCAKFNGLTGMDMVTALASHELVEVATDPEPDGNPGFQILDQDHFVWQVFDGVETGDLCTDSADSTFTPPAFPFVVQRTWSNAAARRGNAPCQPQARAPYFNSAVVMRDRISMHGLGTVRPVETIGIRAGLHETKVVEIDLFSDGPTSGPWQISTVDISGSLSLSLDRASGQNGEKVYLTITVNAVDPHLGADAFHVVSTLGTTEQRWYGIVGQ